MDIPGNELGIEYEEIIIEPENTLYSEPEKQNSEEAIQQNRKKNAFGTIKYYK